MIKPKCLCLFPLLLIGMFLSSCVHKSDLTYVIINKTSGPLKVHYQFPGGLLAHIDTIPVGSSQVINQEQRLGNVDEINQRLDSIDFSTLVIGSGDKISPLSLKNKKDWAFKKDNDLKATYTLTIDDRSFTSY